MKFILLSLCLGFSSVHAEDSDVYPYRVTDKAGADMRIINNGNAALYARIDMIRRATKSIDMEYFIFTPDTSGKLIMQELAAAAERGVKVRIMVDKSAPVFALDENYAKALKEKNVDVKYYNSSPLLKISSMQFRNHRKLIVRDGEEAITGGRNIADEYFNMSKEFNFLDRDASVEGDIVKAMQKTYDLYWNSDIMETPKDKVIPEKVTKDEMELYGKDFQSYEYRRKEAEKKLKEARDVFTRTDEQKKVLAFLESYGKEELEKKKKLKCPEVAFGTDREGASFKERIHSENYHENYRLLRKEIAKWIETKMGDEIVLDSPYFLDNSKSKEITDKLIAQNKKITIFTNSLSSTDAIYVATVFSDSVKKYTPNENFNAYTYKGSASPESKYYSDEIKNATWGTHSKTMVFSDNAFMIGTYNIDNRSNFYNTEMAIFCSGSPELTKDVTDNIKLRMGNAYHLNKDGEPDDCSSTVLTGASPLKKALFYLIKIPSHFLQFLL